MTRKQKKGLIIAGVVLSLPVLFLVEEHLRGKWALAKLKGELLAKGEKLTIDECRPAFGSGENGHVELLQTASMLVGSSLTFGAPRPLRAVLPGKVQVIHSLSEWQVSDGSRKGVTNNNWRALEESLDQWRDALASAKAAIRKPAFDANLDYARGFNTPVPHLARFKAAAQHLGVEALIHLHHGRLDEAIDKVGLQLRLSHHMRNERLLISQLVRISIVSVAMGPTWQILQWPGLTDAHLARLQRAWETNEFLVSMIQALEMERAMGVALFSKVRHSAEDAAKMLNSMPNLNPPGTGASAAPVQSVEDLVERVGEGGSQLMAKGLLIPLWQFAWSRHDETFYLEVMQELLTGSRQAEQRYSFAPMSAVAKQLDQHWENQSSFGRIRRQIAEMLAAALASSPQRAASIEAQRALTTTAIALKRYELRRGAVPATLKALVPEFLHEIPRDIFDGQPLRYRPGDGSRFVLYSIGKDERDDGGDPAPAVQPTRNLHFTNGRDWVWPMPATEEEIQAAEEKEKQRK